jgi:hypothetical protein
MDLSGFNKKWMPDTDDFYETFDPDEFPGGIICHGCDSPLTKENVFREMVDEKTYILCCVHCAVSGKA